MSHKPRGRQKLSTTLGKLWKTLLQIGGVSARSPTAPSQLTSQQHHLQGHDMLLRKERKRGLETSNELEFASLASSSGDNRRGTPEARYSGPDISRARRFAANSLRRLLDTSGGANRSWSMCRKGPRHRASFAICTPNQPASLVSAEHYTAAMAKDGDAG